MLNKKILKGIKILKRKGKPLTLKKVNAKQGVKFICTSCFVEEENVIIRGGSETSTFWIAKKVKIFAIDGTTKEIRGEKSNLFALWIFYRILISLLDFPNFEGLESLPIKVVSAQFKR